MPEAGVKHFIAPIFLPHQGCPHRCIFCEQERITAQTSHAVTQEHIASTLRKAVKSPSYNPEGKPQIAFYGGTFTSLPRPRIQELLGSVAPFLRSGQFHSVRVSTRPDAVDKEICDFMWENGVRTVELGAQSFSNHVLSLSRRGHTAEDTAGAVQLLRDRGFEVGVQLMMGLPGDSMKTFRETVSRTIQLAPSVVRLYPVLVIRGTGLADLYHKGRYTPVELHDAVDMCSEACARLEAEKIRVIRIGLMNSPSLSEKETILAGPWHPAFGFLVRSRMYRDAIAGLLPQCESNLMVIHLRERDIPLLRGYKNQGVAWLRHATGAEKIRIKTDNSLPRGQVRIDQA